MFFQPLEQFATSISGFWLSWFPFIPNVMLIDGTLVLLVLIIAFLTIALWIELESTVDHLGLIFKTYFGLIGIFLTQLDFRAHNFFLLFCVFLFAFAFINVIGLIPFYPCLTAQLVWNLTLSFCVMVGITITGFERYGLSAFKLFLPHGVPLFIYPLVVFLEFVSYLTRIFSLALRLFSNMLSGHSLLHILFGLSKNLLAIFENASGFVSFIILVILPFVLVMVIFLFEILVALLQAYVWSMLCLVYLKDFYNL